VIADADRSPAAEYVFTATPAGIVLGGWLLDTALICP
jgi:hypothetical protein